jgi:tRNA G18 (ribose-2'-O)-methylase SpoU
VLVTGSENKGISSDVRRLCQSFVTVMPGGKIHPAVDSLNVGVATGML